MVKGWIRASPFRVFRMYKFKGKLVSFLVKPPRISLRLRYAVILFPIIVKNFPIKSEYFLSYFSTASKEGFYFMLSKGQK